METSGPRAVAILSAPGRIPETTAVAAMEPRICATKQAMARTPLMAPIRYNARVT